MLKIDTDTGRTDMKRTDDRERESSMSSCREGLNERHAERNMECAKCKEREHKIETTWRERAVCILAVRE